MILLFQQMLLRSLTMNQQQFYLVFQNLLGKLGEVYKSKMGWLAMTMNIVHLALFILFVYCIIQFFGTDVTNELVKWASAGFLCMIAMGMLKLFVWMQMDKNDILRELKRLELQLASLSGK